MKPKYRSLREGTRVDYYKGLSYGNLLTAFEKVYYELLRIDGMMKDESLSPDDKVALYLEKDKMWKNTSKYKS